MDKFYVRVGIIVLATLGMTACESKDRPDSDSPNVSILTTLYIADGTANALGGFSLNSNGAVRRIDIDPSSGRDDIAAGFGPFGLAITPDGRFLYSANENANSLSGYRIAANGSLARIDMDSGTGGVQDAPAGISPHGLVVSIDSRYLYASNINSNTVSAYRIESNGVLTRLDADPVTAGQQDYPVGRNPFGMVKTTDGRFLYVANGNGASVSAFQMNADGSLTRLDADPVTAGIQDFPAGDWPRGLAVRQAGDFLFVTNKNESSISAFQIGTDGRLSAVDADAVSGGTQTSIRTGDGPNSLALTPDGRYLYSTNDLAGTVSGFEVVAGGALRRLDVDVGAPGLDLISGSRPLFSAIDAGGQFLLVTNFASGSVTTLRIGPGGVLGRTAGGSPVVATTPSAIVLADQRPALRVETISTSLSAPVDLTAPRGDMQRLFVAEKGGRIRIIKDGNLLATPFLDINTLVSGGGEQGLLGISFDPDYASNGRFYVSYTNVAGDSVLARYLVSGNPDVANPDADLILLTLPQPAANHNGGQVAFGPDGMLYLSLGDGGGSDINSGRGQSRADLYGSLLRLDVRGSGAYRIPNDNPFVGQASARGELWDYGLRNPWRFSFDRASGDLYIADVGELRREEINVAPAAQGGGRGLNYGWSIMEGTLCFNPMSNCDTQGLTLPVLDYAHDAGACSVTGGYVYRGNAIPSLRGTYFYADFCAGWIRSFRYVAGQVYNPIEWSGLSPGRFITSFGEDAAGELYVLTNGGGVYRIVPQ